MSPVFTLMSSLNSLWGLMTMDTDQLNQTRGDDVNPFNCCWGTDPTNGSNALELDDSTRLVGVQVILILAYSTIILLGVTGNSLVIYVIYRFKNLRTVTNFFIVNLAVADLLVGMLCLPFTLAYTLYGEWKFGQVLCFMLPCAQGVAVYVSTITMNVIALDRYRSIVNHMDTKMSKDMCLVVVVFTWAVSALLASPLAIFREYATFDLLPGESITVCTEKWSENSLSARIYSISALLVQYGLPLAVISVAYARIWDKLKKTRRGGNERHQRRRKTTKMLLMMVVVFAVCWLPFHAFQLAVDIDSAVLSRKDYKLLFTLFHIVAMCSTFANPVLYGWMNTNYRMAFLSVFKCYRPIGPRSRCSKFRETQKYEDRALTDCKSTNV